MIISLNTKFELCIYYSLGENNMLMIILKHVLIVKFLKNLLCNISMES